MAMPPVSVVTPVYNGADYLDECIASVVAQDYRNWRYTIVNNCSTDASGEIAESWAGRDSRIRVVHNDEFLGQVDNLNRAMSLIDDDSVWTKMVLADDWIFPTCLRKMVEAGAAHAGIGVVSAYRLDHRSVTLTGLPYPSPRVDGREVGHAAIADKLFVSGSATSLLYRSDLVRARDPFFNPGAWHDDTETFLELMLEHDLGFVHEVLTFTRRENESANSAIVRFDREHRLDELITTMKYGPRFLDPDTLAACMRREERAYYSYLGRRSLYRTGREFWTHHHEGLRRAGLGLDRPRVAWNVVLALLALLTRPAQIVRRIRYLRGADPVWGAREK
jgi:glycosyltransferase involved in cell wall biosynthesis